MPTSTGGLLRPRSATPRTGCSSSCRCTRPPRPRPSSSAATGARVVPVRPRRRAGAGRELRRRILRLGARRADRGAGWRPGRAAVRLRARRRADPRPPRRSLARRRARARARLQDERARRARPGRDRGGRVPAAACRLRARVPARRRRPRSRSSTSSSKLPRTSSRPMFTRRRRGALEASLPAAIARIRAAEFRPTPSAFACSGCPALDVVCAGPRLGAADEGAFEPAYAAAE